VSRSSETLITELSRDLSAVRRIPRIGHVAAVVTALILGAAVIALLSWGLNETFRGMHAAPRYWVAIVGLAVFGTGGAGAALGSSVPGNDRLVRGGFAAMLIGTVLTLLSCGLFLARISAGEPAGSIWSALSLSCLGSSSLVAIPAAVLLTVFAARGFPHRPGLTLGSAALGLVAFGALPVVVSCGSDVILHIVFAHVLAPASAGLALWLGSWAVYRALRRGPEHRSP
jgi:hypothetical protein